MHLLQYTKLVLADTTRLSDQCSILKRSQCVTELLYHTQENNYNTNGTIFTKLQKSNKAVNISLWAHESPSLGETQWQTHGIHSTDTTAEGIGSVLYQTHVGAGINASPGTPSQRPLAPIDFLSPTES